MTHTDWKRGMEMMLHTNGNKKKAGITMLISDKIDFKTKMIIRDKDRHYMKLYEKYIMRKG